MWVLHDGRGGRELLAVVRGVMMVGSMGMGMGMGIGKLG